MNKRLLVSLSAAAILSVGTATLVNNVENDTAVVQAAVHKKKLTKNAYVYNARGKRVGKKVLKKGKTVKILGTKKIHGKKYYRIGKNQYVRTANFVVKRSTTSIKASSSSNVTGTVTTNSSMSNKEFTTTSSKGHSAFPTSKSVGSKTSTSGSSKSNSSNSTSSNKSNDDTNVSGVRYNTKKSSMDNAPTLSAEDERIARKYMNKSVYFTDEEVQQIEDRLWQNIQNYRVSKGYPAFKTNSELTNLAQQAQVPGTREFQRFTDKISQNTNEIKAYVPNLAALGMDQAIGYVDSTIYGLNAKGFSIGGDFTHKGWKPAQVADKLFEMMKNSDGFESRLLYGWKERNAYASLSMHYYVGHTGYSRNSVGISFFTADGTSPEWINAWNKAN